MNIAVNSLDLNYRNFLKEEFDIRKERNSNYSLRAFARDLDMPASKLSEILRGLSGLSSSSATKLASKLQLNVEETEWFICAVEAQHARSKKERAKAKEWISSFSHTQSFDELSLDRFKIISDWYHFALLELTEVEDFSSNEQWIARRLGIDQEIITLAIERLIDFGLLEKDILGNLKQTHSNLATPSGIPSRAIRKHHSQILSKAQDSLDHTEIEKRDFSSMLLVIDEDQVQEASKLIKEFRRNFDRLLNESCSNKKRVYALAVQFFPVDIEVRTL